MDKSLVYFSELNPEFRIDAEYYSPENLKKEDAVTKIKFSRLKDVCEIISGPFGSAIKTENYDQNSNYRYIRGKDVTNFFLNNNDNIYINEKHFKKFSNFHLMEKDILVTVVGMKFGLSAIIYKDDCPAMFSCKSTLIRARKINPFYLLTFLSCKYGYGLLRRGHRGAAQPGINLFDIENIPIPDFTDSFQKLIEETILMGKYFVDKFKKEYIEAQTLLLSELGLFNWKPKQVLCFIKNYSNIQDSVRLDAEYFQPKYDEIVSALKSYKGSWDILCNLAKIRKCVEPGSSVYDDSGIPFVRVSDLSKFEIDFGNTKYISESLYDSLQIHQPKKDEILLSKDATPGIAFHLREVPPKMIPSGGILRLKIKDKNRINEEYLTLVLNSLIVQKQMLRDSGGSIIYHWRPDQIKNVMIPLVNNSIQIEIKNKITESFENRKKSKKILEIAKRSVEIAIEKDEITAQNWIDEQLRITKINLKF